VTSIIEIAGGVSGYRSVVDYVLRNGVKRCPRGRCTLDAGWVTVLMHDTRRALPLGVGRGVSRHVAAVEAAQLVGAFSDPALTIAASENFAQFREDTGQFHGAYGRRIGDQVHDVVKKLTADPHSRQAVVTLWDPLYDNEYGKRDYPCTVTLIFALAEDAQLELSVTMRSQDVWLGAPYDWFQFTQLQRTVATVLGAEVGVYRHTSVSTHLYERDVESARELVESSAVPEIHEVQPKGFARRGDTWYTALGRARTLPYTDPDDVMTVSDAWYRQQFTEIAKKRYGGS
jgi:thymidylate synthase